MSTKTDEVEFPSRLLEQARSVKVEDLKQQLQQFGTEDDADSEADELRKAMELSISLNSEQPDDLEAEQDPLSVPAPMVRQDSGQDPQMQMAIALSMQNPEKKKTSMPNCVSCAACRKVMAVDAFRCHRFMCQPEESPSEEAADHKAVDERNKRKMCWKLAPTEAMTLP
jgi:hypothetical protein